MVDAQTVSLIFGGIGVGAAAIARAGEEFSAEIAPNVCLLKRGVDWAERRVHHSLSPEDGGYESQSIDTGEPQVRRFHSTEKE
jgi:hypothetical protein